MPLNLTEAVVVRVAPDEKGEIVVTLRTPTVDYEARLRSPHHICGQAHHLRAMDVVGVERSSTASEDVLVRPPCGCLYRVLQLNALPPKPAT